METAGADPARERESATAWGTRSAPAGGTSTWFRLDGDRAGGTAA